MTSTSTPSTPEPATAARPGAWRYNERPDGLLLGPSHLDAHGRELLTAEIWQRLLTGQVHDPADQVADLAEIFELSVPDAQAAWETGYRARLDQQAGWSPEETTANLAAAFTELETRGVLARGDYACCGTCGHHELRTEIDQLRVTEPGRRIVGYVFFHSQSTEQLVAGSPIYLGYGAVNLPGYPGGYNDADRMIEDVVVPTLRRHGVRVRWNGSLAVEVRDGQWYVPLPPLTQGPTQ